MSCLCGRPLCPGAAAVARLEISMSACGELALQACQVDPPPVAENAAVGVDVQVGQVVVLPGPDKDRPRNALKPLTVDLTESPRHTTSFKYRPRLAERISDWSSRPTTHRQDRRASGRTGSGTSGWLGVGLSVSSICAPRASERPGEYANADCVRMAPLWRSSTVATAGRFRRFRRPADGHSDHRGAGAFAWA
jgi:hypothetical protein